MNDELDCLEGFVAGCSEQQTVAPPSLSHALAIIAPGACPFSVGKSTPTIDSCLFHASTGHANEFLMRETAKQQGVRLVGEMQPCVGCVEAKGRREPVPRRGTLAAVPFGKVHIDLTGPFSDALDGSRYLIMFVDSASRWQRGYGMRPKSDTLKFVQRFFADMNGMSTPGCFRKYNGGEFTGSAFTSFCDAAGIRREYTAPDTPKQNAVVESAIPPYLRPMPHRRRPCHQERSSAPSPISDAPSSAPPSTATTPPRSPPGLPPPPPQPTSAATPAPPHPPLSKRAVKELGRKDTRVHGRTRGDGVRFMEEQQQPPSGSGTALHQRLGLLAMMDKDSLISSLATREAVDQGRRDLPPPPQPDPSLGGRGSGGAVGAGRPVDSGRGWRPQMFATMFATREDVDAALRAERPPDKMADLPHCLASDLRVPKTFKKAMRSQHSELWDDAVDRELFGLLDAGTFSPV
ncbi:unnamed protein product [Ectocarpus sp. CCAP 1310/34]|nr:unnamed protein product [Ectocarpus sp. CCAP 1310/34]